MLVMNIVGSPKLLSFQPVWRVCKNRTHTVNDDYQLLELKIEKRKIIFFFYYFSHPLIFFPSSPIPASPQPLQRGGGAGGA